MMDWVLMADQWILMGLCVFGSYHAYQANKNTRFTEQTVYPMMFHIVQLVDPNYPQPPPPPPIEG